MQFGVREGFLIATAVLVIIAAVFGLQKLRARKYTTIRSNADPLRESSDLEAVTEPNTEVAGGARVVGYRDLEDIDTINQRLREEVERSRPTLKSIARIREQNRLRASQSNSGISEHDAEEDIPVLLDPASEVRPPTGPAQNALFEEEKNAEQEQVDAPEIDIADGSAEEEPAVAEEVLILNVMTSEDAPYKGLALKELLFGQELTFSESNFFQSISDEDGAVQFCVANVFNPGSFDTDNMDAFSTIGLCFFQPLTESHDNEKVFNFMLKVAESVVSEMGGQLCDENRSTLTNQTVDHYLTRIREFEMRLKSADI